MNSAPLTKSDATVVSSARGLDTLAYVALWLFVLTISWSDAIPMIGGFVIGTWFGLLAVVLGLMRVYVFGSSRPLTPLHLWMLVFVAWAALSILWTIDPANAISRAGTYTQLLISAWLIWELAEKESRVVGLLLAYLLGTVLGSVTTLFNYWIGRASAQFIDTSGGSVWDQNRYSIDGFNANDLGLTLALGMPIAFYLMTRKRGFGWFAALWLMVIVCTSAILLTGSRGSLLALLAGSTFIPLLITRMAPGRRTACICLCVALVLGSVLLTPGSMLTRYQNMFGEVQGGTLTNRTLIWTAGLDVFRDHPLLGTGAGSYGAAVLRAIDKAYVAHNTFLSVLVELGVVGAILFCGLLAAVFVAALQMPHRERYLWLALFITWAVGVSALTWEYRKPTWFLFALLATHAYSLRAVVRRPVLSAVKSPLPPWEQPFSPRTVDTL